MQDRTLHFKCDHCNSVFDYPESGVAVRGILAIMGKWIAEMGDEYPLLLENPPEVNSIQTVSIGGKLRIDLNREFWFFYDEPLSFYNGLESLEGINSIRFCRCSLVNIQSSTEKGAMVTVKVEEVVSLEELSLKKEFETEMPGVWKNFITSDSDRIQVQDFDSHLILSINIQSDLGITLVVKRGAAESQILMVNDWDMHRDAYYGTNIKMKNSELKNLGVNI